MSWPALTRPGDPAGGTSKWKEARFFQPHWSQAKGRGAWRKGSQSRDCSDGPGKCGLKQHRGTRGGQRVPFSPRSRVTLPPHARGAWETPVSRR